MKNVNHLNPIFIKFVATLFMVVLFQSTFFAQTPSPLEKATESFSKAKSFFNKAKYPKAISAAQECNEIAKENNLTDLFFRSLDLIAYATLSQGKTIEAKELWNKNLFQAKEADNKVNVALAYQRLGEVSSKLRNLEEAELYHEEALEVCKTLKTERHKMFGRVYRSLGDTYIDFDKFSKASDALELARFHLEKIGDWKGLYLNHNSIGNTFRNIGEYQKARIEYFKALKYYKKYKDRKPAGLVDIYLNIGWTHYYEKNYDLTLRKYNQALKVIEDTDEWESKFLCYYRLGQILTKMQKFKKALKNFQLALSLISPEIVDVENTAINPSPFKLKNNFYALAVLEEKGNALKYKFEVSKDTNDLKLAFNTFQDLVKIIDSKREEFYSKRSKLFFQKEALSSYESTISVSLKLYNLTGNSTYFNYAFEVSEKTKSNLLFSNIKELENILHRAIPDNLLSLEKSQRQKNKDLETQTYLHKEDNSKINDIRKEYLKSLEVYDSIVKVITADYPYFKLLKVENKQTDLQSIRNSINDDKVILEYFYGDSTVHVFAFTSKKDTAFSIEKTSLFSQQLDTYLTFIDTLDTKADKKRFISSAYYLYNKLLAPVKHLLHNKSIVIIPDGKLYTIPFEAFLTKLIDSNFIDLPYLVKSNSISYAHSLRLLNEFNNKKNDTNSDNIVAFSPKYANKYLNNKENENEPKERIALAKRRGGTLPYAEKEVLFLQDSLGAFAYIGEEVTESLFKAKAGEHRIIHIAGHTFIDDVLALKSAILFSIGSKNEDDNLELWELNEMNLNASLAVLSACETGIGTLETGEGVMSLSRGFFMAGCPSVIMSLWSIEDENTSIVIQEFYKELIGNNEISKDKALQNAKLNYIKMAEKESASWAHPYYWAGVVGIGNMTPLEFKEAWSTKKVLGVIALIIILLVFFRNRF